MKQQFPNSSFFGDHDATKVFAVITIPHCETSAQTFREFLQFHTLRSQYCILL